MTKSVSSRSMLLAVMTAALSANAAVDVCYFGGPNLPNFKLNGNARSTAPAWW